MYPVLFGYRQYLELRLKALVTAVNEADGVEKESFKKHDLLSLWGRLRTRLADAIDEDDLASLKATESVIKEFHTLDPKSDGLRFPSGTSQLYIDLPNLRAVMERVSYFLDAMSDWWEANSR